LICKDSHQNSISQASKIIYAKIVKCKKDEIKKCNLVGGTSGKRSPVDTSILTKEIFID
jgi:hypothetical protein